MANVVLLSAASPSTSSAAPRLRHVARRRPSRRSACPRSAASRLSIMAALGEDPIRQWILTEGKATKITGVSSIGGGCINSAQCYKTNAGSFFVKTNGRIGPSMFEGEALGLKAMYDTNSIRALWSLPPPPPPPPSSPGRRDQSERARRRSKPLLLPFSHGALQRHRPAEPARGAGEAQAQEEAARPVPQLLLHGCQVPGLLQHHISSAHLLIRKGQNQTGP